MITHDLHGCCVTVHLQGHAHLAYMGGSWLVTLETSEATVSDADLRAAVRRGSIRIGDAAVTLPAVWHRARVLELMAAVRREVDGRPLVDE